MNSLGTMLALATSLDTDDCLAGLALVADGVVRGSHVSEIAVALDADDIRSYSMDDPGAQDALVASLEGRVVVTPHLKFALKLTPFLKSVALTETGALVKVRDAGLFEEFESAREMADAVNKFAEKSSRVSFDSCRWLLDDPLEFDAAGYGADKARLCLKIAKGLTK